MVSKGQPPSYEKVKKQVQVLSTCSYWLPGRVLLVGGKGEAIFFAFRTQWGA